MTVATPIPASDLEELMELLSIPSISGDTAYKGEVRRTATWLTNRFEKIGADENSVQLHETKGHPIVTARFGNDPNKPTILVYGHYDVQPVDDPENKWITPPFEPTIRDGRLYGRGTADDKGQFYLHLKAVEEMKARGGLPCNVVFLIEGEEEVSSPNLVQFIQGHREMLRCDAVVISDTHMFGTDVPSMAVSMRGIAAIEVTVNGFANDLHSGTGDVTTIEVTVNGPKNDLHSGTYGGAIINPADALCGMMAQLHNQDRQVTIPGFYDGLSEQPGTQPTLEIDGILGGYTGEGPKTIIPSKAKARLLMRLVDGQDSNAIKLLAAQHIESLAPEGVTVNVDVQHSGPGAVVDTTSSAYQVDALCGIVAQLHNEERQVTIPGFYDGVSELPPELRKRINAAPFDKTAYMEEAGVTAIGGETGCTPLEQTGTRPTLEVNGIFGGSTGAGTTIPGTATAKITMRLVGDQDHAQIGPLAKEYIESLAPQGVTVNVDVQHSGPGATIDMTSSAYKAAEAAYETVWGKRPLPMYEGGSIPIVKALQDILKVPVVMMGFGAPGDQIHGKNESFIVRHIPLGIQTIEAFNANFGRMHQEARATAPKPD